MAYNRIQEVYSKTRPKQKNGRKRVAVDLELDAVDPELCLVDVDQNAVPSNDLLTMRPFTLGVPHRDGTSFTRTNVRFYRVRVYLE
jgi:hypothetical protein